MTPLGISNIAWRPEEEASAFRLLEELGICGLEIAPGLAFAGEPNPLRPSEAAITSLQRRLERHKIKLIAMQSLLFGVAGAALFESREANARLVDGITRAIRLADQLGIKTLVFGSPGARRIPKGMTRSHADRIASETFGRLGDVAGNAGVRIAIEPNPRFYGGDVLTTMRDTVDAVQAIAHPAVRLNFDLGALAMEGAYNDSGAWFGKVRTLADHIHVSEPELRAAPHDEAAFGKIASDILRHSFQGWFSIEMRAIDGDNLERVRTSLVRAARALETPRVAA